jgi:hypothetical protein
VGSRKVKITQSVADSIAAIAWHFESSGMIRTAEKFSDDVYDYFMKLADNVKSYAICREPSRKMQGYKCVPYKRKYTVVFLEFEDELIMSEFILSKKLNW